MITQSNYWKKDLLKSIDVLEKLKKQKRWRDETHVKLEKLLLLNFYTIRKLLEIKKISDQIENKSIPIIEFPVPGKTLITIFNYHKYEEYVAFDSPKKTQLSPKKMADIIIHSLVLSPIFAENSDSNLMHLKGIVFNSDFYPNKVFYITIESIQSILHNFGTDDISELSWTRVHNEINGKRCDRRKYTNKKRCNYCEPIRRYQNSKTEMLKDAFI